MALGSGGIPLIYLGTLNDHSYLQEPGNARDLVSDATLPLHQGLTLAAYAMVWLVVGQKHATRSGPRKTEEVFSG